jgi:hypothetical protein
VVVAVGLTEIELPVTVPIPEIDRVVAWLVVQLRVVELPLVIVAGEAEKELMVGGVEPKLRARGMNGAGSSNAAERASR